MRQLTKFWLFVGTLLLAPFPTLAATPTPASTPTPAGTAVLALVPPTPTVAIGSGFDIVVQIQAGTQQVDSGAAYLNFDQTVLNVASITPGSTLPLVLSNSFNNTTGLVNYSAGILSGFPIGTFTLATIHFQAIALSGGTTINFNFVNPRYSIVTFGGNSILNHVVTSTVTVVGPATPTNSPTPGAATPTPAPSPACCGDRDGDHIVTQSEVSLCEEINLHAFPVSASPACDCDGDGTVTTAEVQEAQLNELSGCPFGPPGTGPAKWPVNPTGIDAVANGRLECRGSQGRACLKTTVLTANPSVPEDGTCWPQVIGGTNEWCCVIAGVAHCVTLP